MAINREWELKIKWNVYLFYKINHNRHILADYFYKYFYHLGKGYALPLFVLLFYFLQGWQSVIHLAVALLMTGIVVPIIKKKINHIRPSRLLADAVVLEKVHYRSFPSADAAFAFTIFGTALLYFPAFIYLLFLLYALVICYGRPYMGVHFPLDILIGSVFGMGFAFVALWIMDQYIIHYIKI